MIYIKAWMSEDGKTACWTTASQREYRQHSVRHYNFEDITVFQYWYMSKLTWEHCRKIAEAIWNDEFTTHGINLDFWEGAKKWRIKNSR